MEAREHDGIERGASERECARRTYMVAGSEKLSGYADGANRFHDDVCSPCLSTISLFLSLSSSPSSSIVSLFFSFSNPRVYTRTFRSHLSIVFLFPTYGLAISVIRMHTEIAFSSSRHDQKYRCSCSHG